MLVWIFLSIPVISAILDEDEFNIVRDDSEDCKICYGFDCTAFSKARCSYYGEVYNNFANIDDYEPGDNDLNEEIGNMILQYVEKASQGPYDDCLPLVSQYTNCNKENICVECEICSCDTHGKWNCSSIQQCVTDDRMVADHRTLTMVLEKVREYKHPHTNERFKRSINEINDSKKMSYEDILKWMYGIEDFEDDVKNKTSMTHKTNTNKNIVKGTTIVSKNQSTDTNSEPDFLNFNDLLKSVMRDDSYDATTNQNEAIFFKNNDPISFDLLKEIGIYNDTEANQLDKPSENADDKTTVPINTALTTSSTGDNDIAIFALNDVKENSLNIKKRDIPSDANDTNVLLPINFNNTIDKMEELQKNIVLSLNKIVNEKQNELEKLTNIKEKLILYLKSIGNISIPNDASNDSKNDENSILNLYQFERKLPQEDLRKHDTNILEKYLIKLKSDIHKVIRDIAGIQRLSNTSIPRDLIVLIRAMKYYVNKENKKLNKIKPHIDHNQKHLKNDTNKNSNNLVDIIISILEVLDKDAPTSDVLVTVSSNLRKILKRIIRTFYPDDFDGNSDAFNPNNILIYLTSIGTKWQNSIIEIEQSSIFERLYSLKSLHITLTKDILRMNNALKLMEFANNRRMTTNSEDLEEQVVFKLASDLQQMTNRLSQTRKLKPHQSLKNKNKNSVKKESLFQKIKKLLKSSKKKLRKLFHKNITKSEIVRQIAREKMDEINKKKMSEYEEIMQRWQNNLNVMSVRNKRSPGGFQNFMYKVKHIFSPRHSRSYKSNKQKNNKTRSKTTTKKIKHHGRGKKNTVTSTTTTKQVLLKKNKHHIQGQH
ncbi:uncharacterized protein LOC124540272 [Vanessa cardui]|uniref:uncharacterized protein LOC124540272 n=1 Tax=Vanessa cardui TaxID=171605 RepID=UPI001F13156A|nr:uncharacterized protein LOC124540272 [Vanessa cardui]